MNTWPDGAMTPFRSEKNTNWEGAYRVPLLLRWTGTIPAGTVSNEIVQHHDWLPTFLAMAAGEPDVMEKLLEGPQGERKDLQGAHRWVQPASVPQRRSEGKPAKGLHLFRRRRTTRRAAVRQLEVRVHGAACGRNVARLGRALYAVASAEAVQPPYGSVRARRHHVEHVLRLVHRSRLHRARGAGASSHDSCRRSKNFRRDKKRRRSRSIRHWRR